MLLFQKHGIFHAQLLKLAKIMHIKKANPKKFGLSKLLNKIKVMFGGMVL